MTIKPLCFIAMPFGRKVVDGRSVEFDTVWQEVIAPAIEGAEMQPLRADEEQVGGIIHKPMFERLMLCEFAVADLTLANANVFYEVGVRHAARPATTVLIVADEVRLPFDVAMLRTMPYRLGADGRPSRATEDARKLSALLKECREQRFHDSPLYQLIDGITPLSVPSDKTDVFRDQVAYAEARKAELANARALARTDRKAGQAAVAAVRQSLGRLDAVEAGVAVDLLLSYRAANDWPAMIGLVGDMSEPLRTRACLHSSGPEDHGDDVNHRGEAGIGLFVARGDASKRLDGTEEVFNEVAPLVLFRVMRGVSSGPLAQRNDRLDASAGQALAQPAGIECLVADKSQAGDAGHENVKAGDVVTLARQEHEAHQIAKRIDERRNLRRQAAARLADGLILSPPFAPVPC